MFEFIEEPLDGIALSIKPAAEGRRLEAVRHGADIPPGPAFGELLAKGVGIIGRSANRMFPSRTVSNISSALRPSWAWPSVSFRAMGRPMASTRAWILVVKPPRERPMQRDRMSFFYRSRHVDERGWRMSRSSGCRHHKPLIRPPKDDPTHPLCATG